MTKEKLMRLLKRVWAINMWLAASISVLSLVPQPLTMFQGKTSEGVSWETYVFFMYLQATYGLHFFLQKIWSQVFAMVASLGLSIITLFLIFLYQKGA